MEVQAAGTKNDLRPRVLSVNTAATHVSIQTPSDSVNRSNAVLELSIPDEPDTRRTEGKSGLPAPLYASALTADSRESIAR